MRVQLAPPTNVVERTSTISLDADNVLDYRKVKTDTYLSDSMHAGDVAPNIIKVNEPVKQSEVEEEELPSEDVDEEQDNDEADTETKENKALRGAL